MTDCPNCGCALAADDLFCSECGFSLETQELVDVILVDAGDKPISVIKEIRDLTGFELREAKDLMDSLPQPILRAVPKSRAAEVRQSLESMGAAVRLSG